MPQLSALRVSRLCREGEMRQSPAEALVKETKVTSLQDTGLERRETSRDLHRGPWKTQQAAGQCMTVSKTPRLRKEVGGGGG